MRRGKEHCSPVPHNYGNVLVSMQLHTDDKNSLFSARIYTDEPTVCFIHRHCANEPTACFMHNLDSSANVSLPRLAMFFR